MVRVKPDPSQPSSSSTKSNDNLQINIIFIIFVLFNRGIISFGSGFGKNRPEPNMSGSKSNCSQKLSSRPDLPPNKKKRDKNERWLTCFLFFQKKQKQKSPKTSNTRFFLFEEFFPSLIFVGRIVSFFLRNRKKEINHRFFEKNHMNIVGAH